MDQAAVAASTREADRSRRLRKKRIVSAPTNVVAGMKFGTALAHDDRAGFHVFAAERLDSQHIGIRVAAVPGGAYSFLMCHCFLAVVI